MWTQGYGRLPSLDGAALVESEKRLGDMKNGLRKARVPANLIVELEQALMVVNHFRTGHRAAPAVRTGESACSSDTPEKSADVSTAAVAATPTPPGSAEIESVAVPDALGHDPGPEASSTQSLDVTAGETAS